MRVTLILSSILSISASHFDDLSMMDNFKFDHVRFLSKKDCALDNYPNVSAKAYYILYCYLIIDKTIFGG